MRLTIFVLGHTNAITKFACPHIVPVNLADLDIGEYQTNQLAESRMFFSDLPNKTQTEYIGFLTNSWKTKFKKLLSIQDLHALPLDEKTVWAPKLAPINWANQSEKYHPGIYKYLIEASELSNMNLINNTSLWCNNFICHKKVYVAFKEFFLMMFNHFHNKYGFKMGFTNRDQSRHVAYFYERITTLYFANQHLNIIGIPKNKIFI